MVLIVTKVDKNDSTIIDIGEGVFSIVNDVTFWLVKDENDRNIAVFDKIAVESLVLIKEWNE